MKVFKLKIIISGLNNKPETRTERIISGDWTEVFDLLGRICADTSLVIREISVTESGERPLGGHRELTD